jgi:hypothetical protein
MSTSITKSTSDRAQLYVVVLLTAVVTAVVLEILYPDTPSVWALGLVVGAVLGVPVERVWRRIAARVRR